MNVTRSQIALLIFSLIVVLTIWPGRCLADAGDTTSHESPYPSCFVAGSMRDAVLRGEELTANDHYAAAESLFTEIAHAYPASPIGPLFVAAAIHAQMLDTESDERTDEFRRWLDEAQQKAEAWREREPDNGEAEFLLGAVYGYDAVYESRWGGWFAALKKGIRSKNACERALKKDSTVIDAYLGIGNYNYWKSAKTEFINWLPIMADNKRLGLAQLQEVAVNGVISRAAARASLCWALMNEQDYTTALAHADTLAAQLPDAKAPLWIEAQAYMGLYRWDDAIAAYKEIERRIQLTGPGNYYNLIECAYQRARALNEAGHWREALAACHEGLAYPAPKSTRDRQKDTLNDLRKLQRRLKEMIAAVETDGNGGP